MMLPKVKTDERTVERIGGGRFTVFAQKEGRKTLFESQRDVWAQSRSDRVISHEVARIDSCDVHELTPLMDSKCFWMLSTHSSNLSATDMSCLSTPLFDILCSTSIPPRHPRNCESAD